MKSCVRNAREEGRGVKTWVKLASFEVHAKSVARSTNLCLFRDVVPEGGGEGELSRLYVGKHICVALPEVYVQ